MKRFEGKVAVVTGGNSGIGFATARRLLDEGARVVIVGRDAGKVGAAVEQLGGEVLGLVADVASNRDLDALYAEIEERVGRIDVLFANAGVAFFAPVSDVDEEHFDRQVAINQRGLYFTVQKALGLLGEGAAVVLNTSVVNEVGFANSSAYAATKAAARSYARTLAGELAPRKIRVNAVSPGPVETPIFDKSGLPPEAIAGFSELVAHDMPLKRFGKPEEVAAAVAFLASSDASFITGAELPVDGGLTQV